MDEEVEFAVAEPELDVAAVPAVPPLAGGRYGAVTVMGALPTMFALFNTDPDPAGREPRSRGAMMAANFSAAITPLIRMVRSTSPRVIAAVRTRAAWAFSDPLDPESCWFAYHAAPPSTATPARIAIQFDRLRGGGADARRSSGAAGRPLAGPSGSPLGTDALLIDLSVYLSVRPCWIQFYL